jgi:hypothetical protein
LGKNWYVIYLLPSISIMPESCSGLTLYSFLFLCLTAFMEQLMALGIEPGDQDSAAKSLATLKFELGEEKVMDSVLLTMAQEGDSVGWCNLLW